MAKREPGNRSPQATPHNTDSPGDALESLLKQADKALGESKEARKESADTPAHRRLRVVVSEDRLEAHVEAVFADTTMAEIRDALQQVRVVWGVQEETLRAALARADKTGRREQDVLAAVGKPAVYRLRQEVHYPFLDDLRIPGSEGAAHLASSDFREIREVMARTSIDQVRGYPRPALVARPGQVLMTVQGKDEIEHGRDVYGKVVRKVQEEILRPLNPGEGVVPRPDGSIVADRFGFVVITATYLSVISPIWISPDRMEAYYVNPPQLGEVKVPDPSQVEKDLDDTGVTFGIDLDLIQHMCTGLASGHVLESCIPIAHGERPQLAKGQVNFAFEPLPAARFEAVKDTLQLTDIEDVTACEIRVTAVNAGVVLVEQAERGDRSTPGKDLFGHSVVAEEPEERGKFYKAGVNVRREEKNGLVHFVSEIYGYPGIVGDRITVLSPLWVSPDKMEVDLVALDQGTKPVLPSIAELEALLEQSRIRHGVDLAAVAGVTQQWPEPEGAGCCRVLLAKGTPPVPGDDGTVELVFKQMPDPGKMLEKGKMDFRERDAVPQSLVGDLLARRTLPTPGTPGKDVRGRVLNQERSTRELLYAGPNVVSEEKEGAFLFYATKAGWARVIKDTLSILNRFHHRGDVDYRVGNLRLEGDAEIDGNVKHRFRVEATGDVYIGGTVERGGHIQAGGNVVVKGGIIGARVTAGGNVYARFIQDSNVDCGVDLLVRNYVQDSQVQAQGKATVQGNEGGERQLCILGGTLLASKMIDAVSIGSAYGRETRVVVGIDAQIENRLERYRKGMAFTELRSRQAMRGLESVAGNKRSKEDLLRALQTAPPGRRKFLVQQLKALEDLQKLRVSLEHYIEDLEKQKKETAARAEIRVNGSAFSRVTVQIGQLHQLLDTDVEKTVFRLSGEQRRIVNRLIEADV